MNIARMSALQLAVVGLIDRRGRPAARRRDLPPFGAFVEEVGAPLGEPDVRAQLFAGRGAVAGLERRVKALRHRRRVARSLARATGTERKRDQAYGYKG